MWSKRLAKRQIVPVKEERKEFYIRTQASTAANLRSARLLQSAQHYI